jgi:hypothetical protein
MGKYGQKRNDTLTIKNSLNKLAHENKVFI